MIARHNGIAWVHCAEVVPQNPAAGVHDAAASAFGQVRRLLDGAGVRFDQVIRTWLYLGGITEHDGPALATRNSTGPATISSRMFASWPAAGRQAAADPLIRRARALGPVAAASESVRSHWRPRRSDVIAVPLENPARPRPTTTRPPTARIARNSRGRWRVVRRLRDDLHFRHRQRRRLGDPPRRRRGCADAPDRGQHRRADLRGEPLPPRVAGAGHFPGGPGAGPRLHQATTGLRGGPARSVRGGWASCRRSMPWPTFCRPDLLVEIEGIAFSCKSATPFHGLRGPHFRQMQPAPIPAAGTVLAGLELAPPLQTGAFSPAETF